MREGDAHHLVLHVELLARGIARRGQRLSEHRHAAFACRLGGAQGYGIAVLDTLLRGLGLLKLDLFGHLDRILVGLPNGHFLLIFLLFPGIEVGESHKEKRHDDNTPNRFLVHNHTGSHVRNPEISVK